MEWLNEDEFYDGSLTSPWSDRARRDGIEVHRLELAEHAVVLPAGSPRDDITRHEVRGWGRDPALDGFDGFMTSMEVPAGWIGETVELSLGMATRRGENELGRSQVLLVVSLIDLCTLRTLAEQLMVVTFEESIGVVEFGWAGLPDQLESEMIYGLGIRRLASDSLDTVSGPLAVTSVTVGFPLAVQ